VGKTSLAHAVAMTLAGGGHDSITWVELSPVREAALVLPTVGQALGLPEVPGVAAVDRLVTAIADRTPPPRRG
jgi:predicted ATPase